MKKLLTVLIFLFPAICFANQRYDGWCEVGGQSILLQGLHSYTKAQASYPGCLVTVYVSGTQTLATIFSDNLSNPTPLANPFTASTTTGQYGFYAALGHYDVVMSGGQNGGFASPVTITDVLLQDATSGGGGTNLLPLNNVWTGTNTWDNTSTFQSTAQFNGAATFASTTQFNGNSTWANTTTETFNGPTIFNGQPTFNTNVTFANLTANVFTTQRAAKYFWEDGYPSSCTVNAVNYTTQLDCAFYSAASYAATNSVQVLLFLSPGIQNTCAGLMENPGSTFVSLKGTGPQYLKGSVITQTCAISNAVVSTVPGDSTFADGLTLRDFAVNANGNAPMDIYVGSMQKMFMDNVTSQGLLATGADSYIKLGSSSSFISESHISNISVNGIFQNSLVMGRVTATVSGGGIATNGYTVTTAGSGYSQTNPAVWLIGHGAGNNQPCTTMPTGLTATMTGSAGNYSISSVQSATPASGCSGTITVKVMDMGPESYGIDMAGVTDSEINNITIAAAGRVAGLYTAHGSNHFKKVHGYYGGVLVWDDSGGIGNTWDATECDSWLNSCMEMNPLFGGVINGTQAIHANALNLDYTSTSIFWLANANSKTGRGMNINGLVCDPANNYPDFHVFLNRDTNVDVPDSDAAQAINLQTCFLQTGSTYLQTQPFDFFNHLEGTQFGMQGTATATAGNPQIDTPHIYLNGQHYASSVSNILAWDIWNTGRGLLSFRADTLPPTDSLQQQVAWYPQTPATSSTNVTSPQQCNLANGWNGAASTQYGICYFVTPYPTGTATKVQWQWTGDSILENDMIFGTAAAPFAIFQYGPTYFSNYTDLKEIGTATSSTNYNSNAMQMHSSIWDTTNLVAVDSWANVAMTSAGNIVIGFTQAPNNIYPGMQLGLRYNATSLANYAPPGWQSCGAYWNGTASVTSCGQSVYSLQAGTTPVLTLQESGNTGNANYVHWLSTQNAIYRIGSQTVTNTPAIDFEDVISSNAYDVRMIASGGTSGTNGQGILNILASQLQLNGIPVSAGGTGTVNSGTAPQFAYYASNGTAVSGLSTSTFTCIAATGDCQVGQSTDQSYKFYVNGTSYFNGNATISGSVGIASSPQSGFTLYSIGLSGFRAASGLTTSVTTLDDAGTIEGALLSTNSTSSPYPAWPLRSMIIESQSSFGGSMIVSSYSGSVKFETNGRTDRMWVLPSGNVQIGTGTDQGFPFYVNGNGSFNGGLVINQAVNAVSGAALFLESGAGSTAVAVNNSVGSGTNGFTVSSGGSTPNVLFQVFGNGHTQIGNTTDQGYPLYVSGGNVYFTGDVFSAGGFHSNSGPVYLRATGSNAVIVNGVVGDGTGGFVVDGGGGGAPPLLFEAVGAGAGPSTLATATGNTLCYNTTVIPGINTFATCSSLRKYKKFIAPLGSSMLSEVMKFDPVSYTSTTSGRRELGFIAEDMQKIDPRVSTFDAKGNLIGIQYDHMVAILTAAIQEQQKQIESLRKEIKSLER